MNQEVAAMLAAHMAGVILGSTVSITIYWMLGETGKLTPFGARCLAMERPYAHE